MVAGRSVLASLLLSVRSLLATLFLPGILAGYVPWRYFNLREIKPDLGDPVQVVGLLSIGLGAALLAACIWEFAYSGRGTLAPIDPPRQLVIRGLYRYVRNPMYLSVTMVVLGEALLARSGALVLYWVMWFLAANLFVLGYEEPALRRRFGRSYDEYAARVGRWVPVWRDRAA